MKANQTKDRTSSTPPTTPWLVAVFNENHYPIYRNILANLNLFDLTSSRQTCKEIQDSLPEYSSLLGAACEYVDIVDDSSRPTPYMKACSIVSICGLPLHPCAGCKTGSTSENVHPSTLEVRSECVKTGTEDTLETIGSFLHGYQNNGSTGEGKFVPICK